MDLSKKFAIGCKRFLFLFTFIVNVLRLNSTTIYTIIE